MKPSPRVLVMEALEWTVTDRTPHFLTDQGHSLLDLAYHLTMTKTTSFSVNSGELKSRLSE